MSITMPGLMRLRDMVERGIQLPEPKPKPDSAPKLFRRLLGGKGVKAPKVKLKDIAGTNI